jgi:hypothetical protein
MGRGSLLAKGGRSSAPGRFGLLLIEPSCHIDLGGSIIPSNSANYWKFLSTMTFLLTKLKRGASVCLMLALGACAPFPHYDVVVPSIDGKVHRNGKPVTDAIVYFESPGSASEGCTFQSEVFSRTNSEGQFQFEQKKQFSFFVFMDRWVTWQICIIDGNARYQGWYEKRFGGYLSEIRFNCDLEKRPHETHEGTMLEIRGICTI